MTTLVKGRYQARFADTPAELAAALDLRAQCFRGGADDRDNFDEICRHVLIVDQADAHPVATFRMLMLTSGTQIDRSYAAQFYDLQRISGFRAPLAELGRFCIALDRNDPDILRMAWGTIAQMVDEMGIKLLFGCSSFPGCDPAPYGAVFDRLRAKHLAPRAWAPAVKSASAVRFADMSREPAAPTQPMPQLLRTYLTMGGWVSDHAVVDQDLGTLHVFTGLEIDAIPAARARALRAIMAQT